MQPKRNIRTNYELQISRLKNESKPGTEPKIRELEHLLKKAEMQDEGLEKEIELLKRKAIVDSETQKWEAIREVRHFELTLAVDYAHVSLVVRREARVTFPGMQTLGGSIAQCSTGERAPVCWGCNHCSHTCYSTEGARQLQAGKHHPPCDRRRR